MSTAGKSRIVSELSSYIKEKFVWPSSSRICLFNDALRAADFRQQHERYDQQRVVIDRQYHQSPDLKPRPSENYGKVLTNPVVCALIFCTAYHHIHISATWHTKSLQHQISFHRVQGGRIINYFLTSRLQTPLMNVVCQDKIKFPNTITSTVDKNVAF
jgi:hypothetical protein